MAETKDVWSQTKTVFLPRAPKGEEQHLFISVNNRDFQIPLGVETKVPLPVWDRIRIMQECQARADAYEREVEKTAAAPEPFKL